MAVATTSELKATGTPVGSLRKAAESLGMSYRAAWGKLRATEDAVGELLVETVGAKRGGYRLTPAGRRFRDKFNAWYNAVEKAAVTQARLIFAEGVQSFAEKNVRPRTATPLAASAQRQARP